MISYANNTLTEYLECLSAREPVPGGGSAAALTGSLGVALIEMVARYSMGKGKAGSIEKKMAVVLETAGGIRQRLLDLTTRDSQVYLKMREAKKAGDEAYQRAMAAAAEVPRDIKALCEQGLGLTPFLREEGNKYLLSDVVAAEALLKAGATAAQAMIEANQ